MVKETPDTTNKYIPGSSEKKRAVMMYLLLGIILVSTSKDELSSFEIAHFKQALGWRAVFLLILLLNIVLLFIPFVRWLAILLILAIIVIVVIFVKQARDGKYYILKQESFLFIFQGIGSWMVDVFDLKLRVKTEKNQTLDDITLDK